MKLKREATGHLEVSNLNVFLPGGLILMGIGFLGQELPKLLRGQHLANLDSALPLIVSVVFLIIGLLRISRYSARFDRSQQRLTWKRIGVFGAKVRDLPFANIRCAAIEIDPNQFVQDHPRRGPMSRLVLSTTGGPLPLAGLYTYPTESMVQARDAINELLGRTSDELAASSQAELRSLVAQGRTMDAVHLVRSRRQCSLAEAKAVVESLRHKSESSDF